MFVINLLQINLIQDNLSDSVIEKEKDNCELAENVSDGKRKIFL